MAPQLHRHGDDEHLALLAWRLPQPMQSLSSAPVDGGWSDRVDWVLNVGVPLDYGRTDLAQHASELAELNALTGPGATLFTAANVERMTTGTEDDIRVDATVGISKPTWAAGEDNSWSQWTPGTINVVVQMPVPLEPAAAVNAIMTITEAKTQALMEGHIPGTGTASDAVVLLWPQGAEVEKFCGPRAYWGSRLARATHQAVAAGVARFGKQ